MDSIRNSLGELGVAEDKVFFESFSQGGKTKGNTQPETTNTDGIDSAEIVFAASGKTLTWQKDNGTILEFAEENGIDPPYSCRQGICLTGSKSLLLVVVYYLLAIALDDLELMKLKETVLYSWSSKPSKPIEYSDFLNEYACSYKSDLLPLKPQQCKSKD